MRRSGQEWSVFIVLSLRTNFAHTNTVIDKLCLATSYALESLSYMSEISQLLATINQAGQVSQTNVRPDLETFSARIRVHDLEELVVWKEEEGKAVLVGY